MVEVCGSVAELLLSGPAGKPGKKRWVWFPVAPEGTVCTYLLYPGWPAAPRSPGRHFLSEEMNE